MGQLRGAEVKLVDQQPQTCLKVPPKRPNTVKLALLIRLERRVFPALAQQLHGHLRTRHAAERLGQQGGSGGVEGGLLEARQLGRRPQVTEPGVDFIRMDLQCVGISRSEYIPYRY